MGRSPRIKTPLTYEMAIDSIDETLRQLEITTPITLLGHSMGAVIAARYARQHPEQVSSLILYNPPMFTSREQARVAITATGPHYQALLEHRFRYLLWRSIKLIPRRPYRATPPISLSNTLRVSRQSREGGYHTIILAAKFIDDLQDLAHVTTLVIGKFDRPQYQETLDALDLPPNVSVKLVKTGHHTIVRNPELATSIVRSHLL